MIHPTVSPVTVDRSGVCIDPPGWLSLELSFRPWSGGKSFGCGPGDSVIELTSATHAPSVHLCYGVFGSAQCWLPSQELPALLKDVNRAEQVRDTAGRRRARPLHRCHSRAEAIPLGAELCDSARATASGGRGSLGGGGAGWCAGGRTSGKGLGGSGGRRRRRRRRAAAAAAARARRRLLVPRRMTCIGHVIQEPVSGCQAVRLTTCAHTHC